MDFDQLEIFLEVARLSSFSRAAEKRFRTQPAISSQIRALEERSETQRCRPPTLPNDSHLKVIIPSMTVALKLFPHPKVFLSRPRDSHVLRPNLCSSRLSRTKLCSSKPRGRFEVLLRPTRHCGRLDPGVQQQPNLVTLSRSGPVNRNTPSFASQLFANVKSTWSRKEIVTEPQEPAAGNA